MQVAPCTFTQSENYKLQQFWDTLDKKASINFKLRVNSGGEPESRPTIKASPMQSNVTQEQAPIRATFEKAPEDDISRSSAKPTSNLAQSENIKKNVQELRQKFEAVQKEKERLQSEIRTLQQQS